MRRIAAKSEWLLQRCVLRRLLEVGVHLARRREDALDAGGRRGGGEVLLRHLGEARPLELVDASPIEDVRNVCVKSEFLLRQLVDRRLLLLTGSFLILPPSRLPRVTLRIFFGGSVSPISLSP